MIRGAITSDRIESDKLYFFIAPARKSNAQISFSQIERTLLGLSFSVLLPPHSLFPRASVRYPIPPTPVVARFSHGKRPSGIFLARVILSTPFRSVAITSSSEKLLAPKMSAKKSRRIQKRILSRVGSECTSVSGTYLHLVRTTSSLTNARSISPQGEYHPDTGNIAVSTSN